MKWSLDSIGIGALAARRVCALPASKVEMRMGRERWVLLMECVSWVPKASKRLWSDARGRGPGPPSLPPPADTDPLLSLSSVLSDPSPMKTDARTTEPSSVFRIPLVRVVPHVRCFSRPRCSHPIFHLPLRCLSVVQPAAPPVHRPAKFMVKWLSAVLFHSSPSIPLSVRPSTWRYPELRSEAVRPRCRPCSTHACMHVRERER